MIRAALKLLLFALILAVDIKLGLWLPTAQTTPLPPRWVEPRRDWLYMYFDNRAWVKSMNRSITAPMFVGSDETPPDTPD